MYKKLLTKYFPIYDKIFLDEVSDKNYINKTLDNINNLVSKPRLILFISRKTNTNIKDNVAKYIEEYNLPIKWKIHFVVDDTSDNMVLDSVLRTGLPPIAALIFVIKNDFTTEQIDSSQEIFKHCINKKIIVSEQLTDRDFQKLDTWPILKNERWSCSWRHAGGIIADMQEKGDYIDWYCSGIRDTRTLSASEIAVLTEQEQLAYTAGNGYVSEGCVTDEIKKDLKKLGWSVLEDEE